MAIGFWETALAAFVGGLAVIAFAGLCRLGWKVFVMRNTAIGRLEMKAGQHVEDALREMEGRQREKG